MNRYLASPLLLALVVPAAGVQGQRTEREAFTWAGQIPAGRWIRVRNLNGQMTVGPAPGDKVEVTATKRWRRSDPQTVRFEVRKYGTGDENVVICALWGNNSSCDDGGYDSHNVHDNDVSVEFRVLVPKGVEVGVSTVNGGVSVAGATGEVEANTVNGDVDAATTGGPVNASTVNGSVRARVGRFEGPQDLSFSTVNGTVVVEFTGDIDADIDLSTVNGRFQTDYPVTVRGRLDPRHLRARIGNGGRKLRMSTVNGDVELRRRS